MNCNNLRSKQVLLKLKQPDSEAIIAEKVDEVGLLIKQLPTTEEQKQTALAKIEEGYFMLGDLYYFQLTKKKMRFNHINDFWVVSLESEYEPEVFINFT